MYPHSVLRYSNSLREDILIVGRTSIWFRSRAEGRRHTWYACAGAEEQIRTASVHPQRMSNITDDAQACVVTEEGTIPLCVGELRRRWHGG